MGDEMVSVAFYVNASPANPVVLDVQISEPVAAGVRFYRLVWENNQLRQIPMRDGFTAQHMTFTVKEAGIYGVVSKGPVNYRVPESVPVVVKGGKDPWPVPPPPPPRDMTNPSPDKVANGLPGFFLESGAAGAQDEANLHGVSVSARSLSNTSTPIEVP